jgi:ABC-type multidrug transport system ATPase subunit
MARASGTGDITLTDVSFSYRRRRSLVLDRFSVQLDATPAVIVGPNGAGKSTVLRLISGQLKPTRGMVAVEGRIGYSPQHPPVLPAFSVVEQVRYAGWLSGLTSRDAVHEAGEALRLAGLESLAKRSAVSLSGGERARLGIACALAGKPTHLILDEPTASLDPISRRTVARVLSTLVEGGISIVITSHTATDIADPFLRVLVMDRGRLLFDGDVGHFLNDAHDDGLVKDFAEAIRGD